MSAKKKKGRVKIGSLSVKEKELAGGHAANIKGGGGNGGINGGDCRNGVREQTTVTR